MRNQAFCDQCGASLKAATRFCAQCGEPVPADVQPGLVQETQPAPGGKRETRRLSRPTIASIASVLVIAAGAVGYAYYVGVFAPPLLEPGEEIGDAHYLYLASENDKWGYIDASGQVVLPFRAKNPYESDSPHDEGLPPVVEPPYPVIDEGGTRWVNRAGQDAFKRGSLQAIGKFRQGLAPAISASGALTNMGWGFVDARGRFVIEPQFQIASEFSEGLAAVSIDGQTWGYVDKTGKLVVTPKFDFAQPFKDGVAEVREGDEYLLIDRSGTPVGNIRSGQSRREDRGRESDDVISEGMWPVYVDGVWGFADTRGRWVIRPRFSSVGLFREGLAPASPVAPPAPAGFVSISRFGFIDKSGRFVIPPKFDRAGEFRRGLARVLIGVDEGRPRYGFIDRTGKFVIRPTYDEAGPFVGEIARVVRGGKVSYIDTTGRVVWPR